MSKISAIRNARIINEGEIIEADIFIKDDRIEKIGSFRAGVSHEFDAEGNYIMPGIIDDQVHFREPGLTHKAQIATESQAAVVGGVTSFMEMPNTKPPAVTQELLQDKYDIAAKCSPANYSFYMGATNDNLEEVLKTKAEEVCGVKIFMGSSTGNMLVDRETTLNSIFSKCPMLIATHCEDEETIQANLEEFVEKYGDALEPWHHPLIRSEEGCLISSKKAMQLAKKNGTRLHILHISTAVEANMFDVGDRNQKKITSEACVHHMYFTDEDYHLKGNDIKCNPAIKTANDRAEIRKAVLEGRIDVIATDHAPHTREEKAQNYMQAPSGLPLIQHTLHTALTFVDEGWMPLTLMVDKMCHAVADIFRLPERGYIREGYFADLVLFDPQEDYIPEQNSIYSKCGWSPFTGRTLKGDIKWTMVNGNIVFDGENIVKGIYGKRLRFNPLNNY